MKKIITLVLTTVLVLSVGTTTTFAQSFIRGENYMDTDGDGICDNTGINIEIGKVKNRGRFVDNNGDGVNDNIGSGNNGYFTNVDADGECDNIGTRQGVNLNQGQGRGKNR